MATIGTIAGDRISKPFPDIFYEEPEPEDRLQQFPYMWKVIDALYHRYKDRTDVFATGGGFIFYNPANGNQRVAPDFLIAFDVDADYIQKNLPNFLIWVIGKAPDFVIEVASESTAANDLGHKRDLYSRLGITEYWRFDGTDGKYYGQPIAGERLIDGVYQSCELHIEPDGSIMGHSELLDLDFYWNGRVFDVLDPATGKSIDRGDVEREARLAAETRAEAERQTRLAAETRERELLETIERLRRQQTNQ